MADVTIAMDLPSGVRITGYERQGEGHGFEVAWPLPERCRCQRCGEEDQAYLEWKEKVQVVRDLDLWGQPSFWIYQPVFFRCPRCHHRQHVVPPFKRKDVAYTFRFEEHVVRMLIGSNEEEVARRLGISAETVGLIVRRQLAEAKTIDPARVITDVGMDELSLKKRHKLYATILTDLSRPDQPEVLAVATGKDEKAGRECLQRLTVVQREQVQTYRVDMGAPFNRACADGLPNAKAVIDRFHVAKKFNEVVDDLRKKNHAGVQGEADGCRAEGISFADVGISPPPRGPLGRGAGQVGQVVPQVAAVAEAVRSARAFSEDL